MSSLVWLGGAVVLVVIATLTRRASRGQGERDSARARRGLF